MNNIKTYEGFFDFFKKKKKPKVTDEEIIRDDNIINNCFDILLELEDLGYRLKIEPVWNYKDYSGDLIRNYPTHTPAPWQTQFQHLGHVKIPKPGYDLKYINLTIYKKHPHPERLKDRTDSTYKELSERDVKATFFRLKDYLKSVGYDKIIRTKTKSNGSGLSGFVWGWRLTKGSLPDPPKLDISNPS